MKTPNYKLQAVVEDKRPWPWIGNAFNGRNGGINILLDRGVALVLADGTVLSGTVKLYMRETFARSTDLSVVSIAEPHAAVEN